MTLIKYWQFFRIYPSAIWVNLHALFTWRPPNFSSYCTLVSYCILFVVNDYIGIICRDVFSFSGEFGSTTVKLGGRYKSIRRYELRIMRIGFRVFEQVSCKECDLFGIFQFDLKRIIKRIVNASHALLLRMPYYLNSLFV